MKKRVMARDDTSTESASEGRAEVGLLDSRPVRFALIYGLPAVVCLLAGSAIYVSRMSVDRDVQVLAQPVWQRGGRAAVRVLGYGDHGELMDGLGVTLALRRPGGEPVEVASAQGARGLPAVDLDVDVPDWPAGPCRLEATVDTPTGREVVAAQVALADGPPAPPLTLPPPPGDRPRGDTSRHDLGDGLGVELLPYGHALVPNLTNVLFVRTTDPGGRPAPAELRLELVGGRVREPLPETVRTDAAGLAALTVHPLSNDLAIAVSRPGAGPADPVPDGGAGAPDGAPAAAPDGAPAQADGGPPPARSARIQVGTAPAQLVMRLASPLVEAGEPMGLRVESLHASRPVYVDAYASGRWVLGRTSRLRDSRAGLRLPAPGSGAGPVLVQAYANPLQIGRGFSAHHVYVLEAGEEPAAAIRSLARRLDQAGVDRSYAAALLGDDGRAVLGDRDLGLERLAAFLLSRLDRGYVPPIRLVSSEQVRSAELVEFQHTYRLRISIAIGLVGLVVTLLIAYSFSLAAFRARRRRG